MTSKPAVILIVDDEAKIRAGLRDFFEDEGFTVLCAESAELGLDVLSRTCADCCSVDIRLPGLSGNDFIVRAKALCPKTRFLIYTGSADYELPDALRAIGVGDEDVLAKPVENLGILLSVVNRLLGRPAA